MEILQKSNSIKLQNPNLPIMHGHTSIVLKNVKTGLVERVESDNTFQSAKIAQYMRSLGQNAISQYDVDDTPYLWQNVVGGIFLFRDAITVGSSYMPAGNKMVGNGSYNVVNNSDTTEMGSYSSQSSASGSAITQIYEYMTNQANGTIGSVCLTSALGGYIGYGNASGHSLATKKHLLSNRNYASDSKAAKGIQYGQYEYTSLGIDSNQQLKIRKRRRGCTVASVFDDFYTDLTFDLSQIGNHYGASSTWLYLDYVGNGKFRGIPQTANANSISAGGTIYYYEFDATNDTLTEKTLVNSAGVAICLCNSYQNWTFWGFGSDTLFCIKDASNDYKREIIKVSNGAHIAELAAYTDRASGHYGHDIVPGIIQFKSDSISGNTVYFYDTVANTCYPCNMDNTYDSACWLYVDNNDTLQDSGQSYDSSYSDARTPINSPLYLATINNLGSPVTKTAAQTMKVTYTLTEA